MLSSRAVHRHVVIRAWPARARARVRCAAGTDITKFQQLEARVVLNLVHFISLFTFATLVSMFTEDVRNTVDQIRM